jgi:cytochrome c oxidase assembly protein subunit 15
MPYAEKFQPDPRSVWSHRFAVLTALLTLPLLFIGGLVTTKGVGLVVPDWPTTFGESMFSFPWSRMIGGVFYEHGHRLAGAAVGLLTLLLTLWLWFQERTAWIRGLGLAALALVMVQGVVGGLRVVMVENALAIFHACLAQGFFALMVALAIVTSRAWHRPFFIRSKETRSIQRLAVITTSLIYLQIAIGAVLRHTGAQLEMHMLVAALVAVHAALLLQRLWNLDAGGPKLFRGVALLGMTLLLQLGLGVSAYLGKFHPGTIPYPVLELITTSHVVVGALLLGSSVCVTLWSYRLLAPADKLQVAHAAAEQVTT